MVAHSFFVYLPSNVIKDGNKTSSFKVTLPKHLDFNSNWSVALTAIQYPHLWANIGTHSLQFLDIQWLGGRKTRLYFPSATVTNISDLEQYIETILKEGHLCDISRAKRKADFPPIEFDARAKTTRQAVEPKDNPIVATLDPNPIIPIQDNPIIPDEVRLKEEEERKRQQEKEDQQQLEEEIRIEAELQRKNEEELRKATQLRKQQEDEQKRQEQERKRKEEEEDRRKLNEQLREEAELKRKNEEELRKGRVQTEEEKLKQQEEERKLKEAEEDQKRLEEEIRVEQELLRKNQDELQKAQQRKQEQEIELRRQEAERKRKEEEEDQRRLEQEIQAEAALKRKNEQELQKARQQKQETERRKLEEKRRNEEQLRKHQAYQQAADQFKKQQQEFESSVLAPFKGDNKLRVLVPDTNQNDNFRFDIKNKETIDELEEARTCKSVRSEYPNLQNDIKIAFNSNHKKFDVSFSSQKIESLYFSKQLSFMIGMDKQELKKSGLLPFSPELRGGIEQMFIYCPSLIEHSIVGQRLVPLLRILTIKGEQGTNVEESFVNPEYRRVLEKHVEEITIEIRDAAGQLFNFNSGNCLLTLNFKKLLY